MLRGLIETRGLKSSHRSFASRSSGSTGWVWCTLRVMSLGVEQSVSFTISDLRDSGLPNHTSYRNFSHISVVTFGLSSISKKLRRKRTSVRLSSGEKTHLSHLILAIAATTSGLHRSFARTFMAEEEKDAVILRDVKMRIDGAVEQRKIKLLTKRSAHG